MDSTLSRKQQFPGLPTNKQQRVAERLLELFEQPTPNGQVPGERELAERLSVSRRTIRTVLQWLEQRGHVRTVPFHGRQSRVATQARSTLSDTVCLLGDVAPESVPAIVRPDGRFDTTQYAAAAALRDTGYHTLILQIERVNAERRARLIADRPAGMVLFQHFASVPETRLMAEEFRAARIPFVFHSDDPSIDGFDFVCSDHDDGSYRIAQHLIERGCRRILRCWITPPGVPTDAPWLRGRSTGSARAIREAGLEVLPEINARCDLRDRSKTGRDSFEHGVHVAAGYLLDFFLRGKAIDAILAPSDPECMWFAAACRKFGLTPGKDILIAGYDNCFSEHEFRQWEPYVPAATVDKKNAEIGTEMIRLLLARMNGALPSEPQRRIIRPDLIIPASQ